MPTCPRCNADFPEGANVCGTCGYNMSGPSPSGGTNPWEKRSELGFFKALIETIKMVITKPAAFYGTLEKDGDWGGPIIYAVIISWIGVFFGVIWNMMFQLPLAGMGGREAGLGMLMSGGVVIVILIVAPILVLIGLFIMAGLLHLAGMILGDGEKGFEVTFKVVAYTATTNIANIVPFCGGLIQMIWALVLYMVGMTHAHKTEPWKGILAPILVMVLCCICIILFYMFLFASIMGMAGMSSVTSG